MKQFNSIINSLQQTVFDSRDVDEKKGFIIVSDKSKYMIMTFFGLSILASSFYFNNVTEIISGLLTILQSPSILVTDYMAVGSIGSALFNSGSLILLAIFIAHLNKINMNGPIIAAIFTIGGFALFGKNLYNIWSIMAGVYLHARYQKETFSKFILVAFFGTALGPLVSQISFGFELPLYYSIPLATVTGVLTGFCLPPLANHFVKFHQGFNLYNMGFTAGVTGMIFMALFRSFDYQNPSTLVVIDGYNAILSGYLMFLFTGMLIVGLYYSRRVLPGLMRIWSQPGRLVADFVTSDGFGASALNMSLLGFISTYYVLLIGGQLNGPIIGGIFTIVGFGAFGKHVKNVFPILLGVYLAALFQVWEPSSTGALLAALFGTTLAPIAGTYGWIHGIFAGFLHMAVVMNVGYLHGGMNLYNNGFSGGFVAATLVPIFDVLKRDT